jgi:hypothetical protein
MIQYSVPFETTWLLRILLLISVALLSACENEDVIKPQSQPEPADKPLPVSEWYPTPKHRQQPTVYVPVPAAQQQPVMTSPGYQGNVVQQPWGTPAQQPIYYSAPQPVYPAQPQLNPYQQPQPVWSGQQPTSSWQLPVVPQYQYAPRPWGNVTAPGGTRDSNTSTEAWPQGGYVVTPWGAPPPGSLSGGATGQAGQVPGTIYYAY